MPKPSPSSIQTASGVFVDPFDPDPEAILIEDIAHALANQCRFSGHTRWHHSVAAHSILVSKLCPPRHRLAGLLHDAAEAYLVDLPRPIKRHAKMAPAYDPVEAMLASAIGIKFGVYLFRLPREVKMADNAALVAEANKLLHGTGQWESIDDLLFDVDHVEYAEKHWLLSGHHHPQYIKSVFLSEFHELSSRKEKSLA
jgi:5'-deoxynucleotidase YfbR-like HD superfamily hydrolase